MSCMADDAVFRSSLVWLAAVMLLVGLYTQSFKKTLATYLFGMFAIGGLLLPDWEFFDREISRWCSPVSLAEPAAQRPAPTANNRFRMYPIRTVIYAAVYGLGFYWWWTYVFK